MIVEQLRGGLIVSVQAAPDSLLNTPETISLLARVAECNGARAVRIEGAERIAAARRVVGIPIIGIVKRAYPGYAPYITVTPREVAEAAAAGADIIAYDATLRKRPHDIAPSQVVAAILAVGLCAMADCADIADARTAVADGATIVASTLCGYTDPTRSATLPALAFVETLRELGTFTVCEGGVASPSDVKRAFLAGADAVVVGTAITNVDALVARFVAAAPNLR